VFRAAFGFAVVHGTGERHFTGGHGHFDVRRIDPRIVGQPVVDVFADAIVRTGVALRTAAAMIHLPPALRVRVAHPRAHFVLGSFPPAALARLRPASLTAAPEPTFAVAFVLPPGPRSAVAPAAIPAFTSPAEAGPAFPVTPAAITAFATPV